MLKNIKAGDTVFVVCQKTRHGPSKEPTFEKVVKVGKKYGYIDRYNKQEPFSLSTGESHHGDLCARLNGYGFDVYISEEVYRKQQHEATEFKRLSDRLVTDSGRRLVDLPPEAVQQIHAVLDSIKERA